MLSAVGYARISKDDTLEGRGVARQTEDIAAVCERNGWELTEVFVDNDVSASRYSTKHRHGYDRLLAAIGDGSADRAVVYDVDRLLRQPRQLEDLIDLCEKRNGTFGLHNVNGELDLVTSSGRFVARVLVSKAAMESDDLSRRLRRAFDQKAAEGRSHGARPFGYEPDGETIREDEASMIRQAVVDVLAGASLTSVAHRWNATDVKPPQGAARWSTTAVKTILSGPHQAGLRRHRGVIVGRGSWPAIVSDDDHAKLAAVLANLRRWPTPSRRTPFTGLIRDPNGVPIWRNTSKGRGQYAGASSPDRPSMYVSIAAGPLEEMILTEAFDMVEQMPEADRDDNARTVALARLAVIEDDLRALADDFGEGRISHAEWAAARSPLERRAAAARADAEKAQHATRHPQATAGLRDRWESMDVDTQRAVLASIIEEVRIHPAARKGGPGIDPDRVEIRWRT